MVKLARKENSTNVEKRGILGLLSVPARYINRKVKNIFEKLVKKEPKKTGNKVYNEEKLKIESIDKLKGIFKLRK